MQHRIEHSKESEPIELANETVNADSGPASQASQSRNEHRLEPASQVEPLALVEEANTASPPADVDIDACVQDLSQCSTETSASEVVAALRTGLQYEESLTQELSRCIQTTGLCARAYDALKVLVPIVKDSSSKPVAFLETLVQLGSDHFGKQLRLGRASSDMQFFDALRLGIILGFEAGLRNEDVPAAGGIGDEKKRSTLVRATSKTPAVSRLSQEEKDAARKAKIARLKGVAIDESTSTEEAQPRAELVETEIAGDSVSELIQQETTEARSHLNQAKRNARFFKSHLENISSALRSLKKEHPEQYQDRIYALASSAAQWLQAEGSVSPTPMFDPVKVKARRVSSEHREDAVRKQLLKLNAALQHAARLVNKLELLLNGSAADISYEIRQLTAEKSSGIKHLEVGVSPESIAKARDERMAAEAQRALDRDPIRMDRFSRDGEVPKIGDGI